MIYHAPGEQVHSYQVRGRTFTSRWRGVDADEVNAFLHRIADELDRIQRELTTARTDAERAKQGLRQWQTRHVGCRYNDPHWPSSTNRGPE